MLASAIGFLQGAVEFSLFGCVEAASLAFIVYFIYAKTRAPAIISAVIPNLNLNTHCRSSLVKLNNIGSELLFTLWNRSKTDPKHEYALAHGVGTQNMLQVTPLAGRKPFSSMFDWGVYFPHVAQATRNKQYKFPQVTDLVKKDQILSRAIKQATEQILREQQKNKVGPDNEDFNDNNPANDDNHAEPVNLSDNQHDYQHIMHRQEVRALSILKDMRSTLNNFLLALTSWILYKLLPCFLSGVVTHTQQIEMLKTASEQAPGIPLIFMPLHRSHLDYIMVTFILFNNGIRSPLVAAGNNLQIPIFGGLLRGLGAFFIKRKIDPIVGKKDIIYRAILHLYLQHSLKMGHNVEFFIEGGRTRTGKPCMPKGGILSVIVNAFMDGTIPDALIVPVSVNYEKLVDGNFVREQKGEKKEPESFGKAMSGIWKALNSKYGLMRIDFNKPYSIKELVQSYNKLAIEVGSMKIYTPTVRTLQHNQSTSSLYGTDVICEEHRNLIDSISRQVVYDCAEATSVMSTNALAFLLLTRYRSGAVDSEIAKGLDKLRMELHRRKDIGFSGDSLHIINYATDLLGEHLVVRIKDKKNGGQNFIRCKGTIESWIELAYYSNAITPHFALQSIVLTTFHKLLPRKESAEENKNDGDSKEAVGVSRKRLIEAALENCEVYRYEYILNKPTQVLSNMLDAALDEMILVGYINTAQDENNPLGDFENIRMARALAHHLESDDMDDDEYNATEYLSVDEPDIFVSPDKLSEQKAVCEILAPFAHTYLCVAESLVILYKNYMLESEFIKFVMQELNRKVNQKTCPYPESISTDSVRNCLKVLEKWYVIEISNQRGLRLLGLCSLYDSSRESLKPIVQRMSNIVPLYDTGYF